MKGGGDQLKSQQNLRTMSKLENKSDEMIRSSFDTGLERRLFIARNNLRLNACISTILLLAQIFPILLPWYADSNYETMTYDDGTANSTDKLNIIFYKNKSRMYLIVSMFSVFVNNHWLPIQEFIDKECPFVMKSGFECLQMNSFQYASSGVSVSQHVILYSTSSSRLSPWDFRSIISSQS